MKRYFRFSLLLICFFVCAALTKAHYRFDSWTTDDGLPQNGVRTITQTPDGYLWFTTFDGLVRFDGLEFTVFDKNNTKGIVNNRFVVVKALGDGSVWAGTEAGDFSVYHDGEWTAYPTEIVPGNQIYDFVRQADGTILISTDDGFYRMADGEFIFARKHEDDGSEKKIYDEGLSGARWEIYPRKTLRIKDGATQIFPVDLFSVYFWSTSAYEDEKGDLWYGDKDKLVHLRVDGSITEYGVQNGYPKNGFAHNFWHEDDGSLWFATGHFQMPGIGLVRFKDGKFTAFGAESGLSDDHIFSVFRDREKTTWLATGRGLNRLRRQIITPLSETDGFFKNEVYPIFKTRDGSVYAGTTKGLWRFKDGESSQTDLGPTNPLKFAPGIQSLWEDAENRLWVGTLDGLIVVENGKPRSVDGEFNFGAVVSAIHSDRYGNVLFGTNANGVMQYGSESVFPKFTTRDGLASNDVKVIHEARDGKLWFGTYGGISIAECGARNDGCRIESYTTADGLASNSVRSIYEDADGTFWIGTYDGGLSRLKDGKFFNFNTGNGLFSNGVFATVEDERGNFWMSGNKGIFRVNKQSLNDYADGKIDHYESFAYGKKDGMLSTECNGGRQPSWMKTEDGKIWFPTLEGVAIVDPNALEKNPMPPPVAIESVQIDRKAVDFKNTVYLEPSDVYLDVDYTALSFIKSDQIPFRYKLEGLDEEWIDAGTRRSVNYTHLPPGKFTFRVIAANSDGVWNTEGKSFRLVVRAPFYQTWQFWASLSIVLIGVVFLLYRFRMTQLQKAGAAQEAFSRQLIESQEQERKRIAQELHDGLGQELLVIKNRAMLGLAVEEKDEQFGEIQDSVTDALNEVRSIAYNLRPLHLERLGLTATLEEMIEEVEEISGIEINCSIEPVDDLFTKENEINFYRIVQESLNNVVKHSGARRASVEIFRENQSVFLNVKDDGRGFDASATGSEKGLGLNGIAERVKILGGKHSIDSETGKGTTVSIEIEN
jgi:signal transduction histidine kinase/ligand-binding sensor domain-containing protein